MKKLDLAVIVIFITFPLHGTVYNATPADYKSFLLNLKPGDTLNLASGNYPFLSISGLNGSPTAWITITGPASGSPATIYANSTCCNAVQITHSSYVAIKNLTIDSKGLFGVDGINAHGGTNNLVHDILIEGNTLVGQNNNQQVCGISTKTPTWGWIIRRNIISAAGTGIYLGDSDGTSPFVAGIIEDNLVVNAIGYDMQIKYQIARPFVTGMPTGQSFTIIRNNVFIKNNQLSPDGDRPNVLVGGFPSSGDGSTDMYEIYGNFFFHNPRESLFQGEGRLSIHDNIFVDGEFAAMNLISNRAPLKIAYVYNNTVYTTNYGIYFGNIPTIDNAVIGNLVFAGTPIHGSVNQSNNMTGTMANAAAYVNAPSFTLGLMDFYPKPGMATGLALDLSKFTNDPDHSIDFNGVSKGSPAIFRGAYAGQGINPGWHLQSGIKALGSPVSTPPATGGSFLLHGSPTEMPLLTNGSPVIPTGVPQGLSGRVVVRGSGSVNYAPIANGDGVRFGVPGLQNTNTGFLAFSGTPVSTLFNMNKGDITFSLKSNYTFTERMAMQRKYVFCVDDGSKVLFYFFVNAANSRLTFNFGLGGTVNGLYAIPAGQENLVFGKGVTAHIRLTWDGAHMSAYLNGLNVTGSLAYTQQIAAWSPAASFTVGATSLNDFKGGYYAMDDAVSEFQIQ